MAALAQELAARRGLTKTAAVKLALRHELERDVMIPPLRDRMTGFWMRHPLPVDLGPVPDKAFYDDLSGHP